MLLAFACSLAIQATSPRNYLYDTKEENGKIVSKTIFLEQNGLLNQQVKYDFAYNADGKVQEKKACRWNKESGKWEPFFRITYQYDGSDEIQSVYGLWNKKTNDYSLNVQNMTLPASEYNEIFS